MTDMPLDADRTHAAPDRPTTTVTPPVEARPDEPVDLDAIERDLAAVEAALDRLADGTYWTDEVTGEPIAEDALTRNPLARRA